MSNNTQQFVAPGVFLKGKGVKLVVGQTVDYTGMGLPPHPLHGPVPVVTVTKVKEDGSLVEGTINCACGTTVVVHAGDVFQKRRCADCQKEHQRSKVKPDEAVLAAKAAAKAEKLAAAEKAKTEKAAQREAAKQAKAAELAAKNAAKQSKDAERAAAALAKAQAKELERASKPRGKTAADLLKSSAA